MNYLFLVLACLFSLYTARCIYKQKFFRGLAETWRTVWGQQFLIDLNIGFLFWGFFYYFFEASLLKAIALVAATIFLGNIFTLFYVFMNYSEIISRFNLN